MLLPRSYKGNILDTPGRRIAMSHARVAVRLSTRLSRRAAFGFAIDARSSSPSKSERFSRLGPWMDKWLIAVWLIQNSKNGISSSEVARALRMHRVLP